MANTRQGQYQIELLIEGFTSPARAHAHRFYVQPVAAPSVGDAMSTIDFAARGGGTVNAVTAVNNYWAFLRPMWNNSISCANATLWYFATHNRRDFITSVALTNPLATGAAPQVAQQVTLTFRAALKAPIKLVLLETNQTGNNSVPLVANAAGNVFQQLAAHVMSASGVVLGIDNSFPVSPLRDSRGQNEQIFREVFR